MITWQEVLQTVGYEGEAVETLSDKDGIRVIRLRTAKGGAVLKIFDVEEQRREIRNYVILQSLGIQTIPIWAMNESAILMEDIQQSAKWRLGVAEDLQNPNLAKLLATWYVELHQRGRQYLQNHETNLYEETALMNPTNMQWLREVSQSESHPFWQVWQEKEKQFLKSLHELPKTLTYNDFFWTNFAIARDDSAAMMFDYNLLGKGFAYSDISNVLSSLSAEAGKAFLQVYGHYDPREEAINRITSPLVGLILAFRREKFPSWGKEPLEQLKSGELTHLLQLLPF